MGRRLVASLSLLAGLLLLAGAGASPAVSSTRAPSRALAASRAASADHVRRSDPAAFAVAYRPTSGAVFRAGPVGHAGASVRQAVILPSIALLTAALVAFLVRQRRRSRPAAWHRSTLFARGPPLLLTW